MANMTSTPAEHAETSPSDADSIEHVDSSHDQDFEEEKGPSRPKSPAYVAPIGSIGPIPSISTSGRPPLPEKVGESLVGSQVNEHGEVVDKATGRMCGRAEGDLPCMVGRRVSNARGDILGDDGELVGYVASVEPRRLLDVLGRSSASLMVDHVGNIVDVDGKVVGKFHDNNNPRHREEREREAAASKGAKEEEDVEEEIKEETAEPKEEPQPRPRRTESERRQNAEAWRKEKPGESPSDIFLDVKSTTEGIQLTVRIPTVFANGQPVKPHVSFS